MFRLFYLFYHWNRGLRNVLLTTKTTISVHKQFVRIGYRAMNFIHRNIRNCFLLLNVVYMKMSTRIATMQHDGNIYINHSIEVNWCAYDIIISTNEADNVLSHLFYLNDVLLWGDEMGAGRQTSSNLTLTGWKTC